MDTKSMLRRLSTGCFQGYGRRTDTWTLSQNRFPWVFNVPFVPSDERSQCGLRPLWGPCTDAPAPQSGEADVWGEYP